MLGLLGHWGLLRVMLVDDHEVVRGGIPALPEAAAYLARHREPRR